MEGFKFIVRLASRASTRILFAGIPNSKDLPSGNPKAE
jgi:hypothetical protein